MVKEKPDKRAENNRYWGKLRRKWNMSLSVFLNKFFTFHGITKKDWQCSFSDIELRKMFVEVAKTSYGLGLQDSRILHNTFLEKLDREKF